MEFVSKFQNVKPPAQTQGPPIEDVLETFLATVLRVK